MRKKNCINPPVSTRRKDISIKTIKEKMINDGFLDGGGLNLAEYRKFDQDERDILIWNTFGGLLAAREDLFGNLKNFLDKLRNSSITIISVTPASGIHGDTVKLLVNLGGYDIKDCRLIFSSNLFGNQESTIFDALDKGGGKTELSTKVPDFPGAPGDLSTTISIEHLRWYTVPIPDINTPPTRFYIIDATSNAVPFIWRPSAPYIDEFWANWEIDTLLVEPGDHIELLWRVHNVTEIRIDRANNLGPASSIHDVFPSVQAYVENWRDIGPFLGNTPLEETYTLTVQNPWGSATASVHVHLNKIPTLKIEGIEVTQGIQTFWRPNVVSNSLATIANKDTIVRVYVSTDLGGFLNNRLPNVTGTLTVGGITLSPINGITPTNAVGNPFITIGLRADINRANTNDTLNFRIPAALANGTRSLAVTVQSDVIDGITPTYAQSMNWTWQNENALRVRYIRIHDNRAAPLGTGTQPTDAEARFTVQRAFDLLPSPPTDIAPARTATWNTTQDFSQFPGGLDNLLDDLDDEHDCSGWEWLWSWTGATECPDADNALWIGLTSPFNRGLANRPGNTCIAAMYTQAMGQSAIPRITPAHELSHNLGFMHVNISCGGAGIGGPFYTHPNGGNLTDVPFDPFWNQALSGTMNDYMSYGCTVWTSEDSWNRLQGVI